MKSRNKSKNRLEQVTLTLQKLLCVSTTVFAASLFMASAAHAEKAQQADKFVDSWA
jgi:hypothetical protein